MLTTQEKDLIKIFDSIIDEQIPDADQLKKSFYRERLKALGEKRVHILITGATGVGKSSTINAIFEREDATVGHVRPETQEVEEYTWENLTIYDSPGLGDGVEEDRRHKAKLVSYLNAKSPQHPDEYLIDLVLVVVDAKSRDLGTTYELINNVIWPNVKDAGRIMVAMNQCDLGLQNGKGWNEEYRRPDDTLLHVLDEKVASLQARIKQSTGVDIAPIYYSADQNYNIDKLLLCILESLPIEKRIVITRPVNRTQVAASSSGYVSGGRAHTSDYKEKIQKTVQVASETFFTKVENHWNSKAADFAAKAGERFGEAAGKVMGGPIGEAFGRVVGGLGGRAAGAVASWAKSWFKK